jgi:hypothetical protein
MHSFRNRHANKKPELKLGSYAVICLLAAACGGGGSGAGGGAAGAVQLSASPPGVSPGAQTTLNWTATGMTSCSASGGWSGNQSTSGSASVGPLQVDTTYSLSCTGPSGNALAMTTVSVRVARLSWQAPTQYTDGSPLTPAGYKVYYGPGPGNYTNTVAVAGQTTQANIALQPGSWTFAVTALDAAGNESNKSNQGSRSVN